MNLGIGDQNVVILTTPRTGSTALCYKISKELVGSKNYQEAFHPYWSTKDADALWQDFLQGKRFVCKIFPDHNITDQELDILCKDSFVIFLERTNLVEQIASYHVLSVTERPWFAKDDEQQSYTVDIDNTKISYSIRQILNLRQAAEVYRQRADISLKYEDIVDSIENEHIRKYDRPSNYTELIEKITKLLPIFIGDRK